ncbi:uncharacterized protein LOC115269769 [Aedes albopictus]|uniref:PHD-type domain-containing protein n=1 Tax=Aedes albopictus TaxID=7160 RepID=A0ABM1ZIQ1_AEDAL
MSTQSKNKLLISSDPIREGGCVSCSRPDSYDDFVQCDQCDSWWHMRCAGVTKSISQRPWTCRTCLPLSVASSSSSARISLRLKQIEEERAIQQREWEAEKRALENERKAMQEKYKLLEDQLAERENATRRSQVSRPSSMRRVSAWVENLVESQEVEGAVGGVVIGVASEADQDVLREEAEEATPSTVGRTADVIQRSEKPVHPNQLNVPMQLVSSDSSPQDGNQQQNKGAIPKIVPNSCEPIRDGNVWTAKGNFTSSVPPVLHPGKPTIVPKPKDKISAQTSDDAYKDLLAKLGSIGVSPIVQSAPQVFATEPIIQGHVYPTVPLPLTMGENESCIAHRANTDPHVTNMQSIAPSPSIVPNVTEQAPSPSQLAARQVMPRDLPMFSGDPAEWPIFISAFENTTVACGYSKVENLARLQRCLKGAAYESVRSRLLLPESVPQVLSTLRLLYGRPELLINVLLNKLRSTPAPRSDKLETLIEFGLAVQSLCDHLVAAGQQPHLTNPYLLMELVDKLPAHVKMDWASYMQRYPEVNLKTFSNFMEGIMVAASKVTLYTSSCTEKTKPKPRTSINTHFNEQEWPKDDERICCICKNRGHRVRECDAFKALSINDRWKTVQFHELCRSCLCAHGKRSCRNAAQCGINGCTFRHHPLLHSNRSEPAPREVETQNVEAAGNHTHRLLNQSLLFRVIPVTLYGPRKAVTTFAFLDDGSQLTLIDEELTRELGVDGRSVPLCITWTGNVSRMEENSKQLRLDISGVDKGKRLNLDDVRTVKKLALPGQTLRLDDLRDRFPYLNGLPISGYENALPRLLIGVNNLHLTVPLKVKEGSFNEPVATKTRLGWCIYGGNGSSTSNSVNVHACECNCDRNLHDLIKDYFILEDAGATSTSEPVSAENKRAQELLQQTTVRVGDRFETGLLWREEEIEFPESYGAAVRRLECLERRMKKNPSLKDNLERQINEYQQKGYAHRASEKELRSADLRRVWYLPLGAVVNPKKPEKVRLIWDAAATVNGVSLNSLLLKGPDQLTSLLAVLVRFRQYSVAVSADIKEMFHQVRIREADRQSQRFLWRNEPSSSPDIFIMDVATFGSTCSPASAQYVKNRNATEYAEEFPRAAEEIIHNHYVDDYLASFETEADAAETAEQVKFIHIQGGFELTNWNSNSTIVLHRVGAAEDNDRKHLFLDKGNQFERVLGMLWLVGEDQLSFCTQLKEDVQEIIAGNIVPTKRQVLRCLMSFFDPLGLLSFLFVHGKILLQDVWRAGIQWDQTISNEQWERWQKWIAVLRHVSTIQIPRCYFMNATAQYYKEVQLHIFVDASEGAYAAVAYFRIIDLNGAPRCALVAAKTKVAPLKPLSIPRLELQAAVLGTRLLHFVLEAHTITVKQRYLWSDSTTVLAWLRADPRKYKQYVACRIGEVLMETDASEWWWVPSKLNPADLATKWGSGPTLDADGIWFNGPPFLLKPIEEWPAQTTHQQTVEEELRACNMHLQATPIPSVIDYDRFSS